MEISRVDPATVSLELAEALAAIDGASLARAELGIPVPSGPSRMTVLQHGNNGRPVDALWVAGSLDAPVGWGLVELPWLDNLQLAMARGIVHPDHRGTGVGSRLLDEAVDFARAHDRVALHTGAYEGTDGIGFLDARGFTTAGQQRYAVRRLGLHDTDPTDWQRLYDEAAPPAAGYELLHVVGPTPDELVDGLVALHEAINDAPADEGMEPDAWDAARLRAYDASMASRHQTTYRVLARHTATGAWAGMSLLCVDEFGPGIAFQEDTNVVRAHRGHRLGLLMKADMLRWVTAERPEIAAVDTWNATDNHHMIAVNERLGCRVIAHHQGFRRAIDAGG